MYKYTSVGYSASHPDAGFELQVPVGQVTGRRTYTARIYLRRPGIAGTGRSRTPYEIVTKDRKKIVPWARACLEGLDGLPEADRTGILGWVENGVEVINERL